ncbi:MAG: hypothetical protein RL235_662 [Chlamydiota bacterium]|jgi:cysteine desulfurase
MDQNPPLTFPVCQTAIDWAAGPYDDKTLQQKRGAIDALLSCRSTDRFVFTTSGAEAISQTLFSAYLEVARLTGKTHFVTTAIEEAATLQMMQRLGGLGCTIHVVPVTRDGIIDLKQIESLITRKIALVSMSMASGLTGVIQPYKEIADIARAKGALIHLDAAHALGRFHFAWHETGADYMTFDGGLIHAPKATGGLVASASAPLAPLIVGGNRWRGGPTDPERELALYGAAHAAHLYLDAMSLEGARLRDQFETQLVAAIPGAAVLYQDQLRSPNVSCVLLPRTHQETLLYYLQPKTPILTQIGGHYAPHLKQLLMKQGVDPTTAARTLSVVFHRMVSSGDVTEFVEALRVQVTRLEPLTKGLAL